MQTFLPYPDFAQSAKVLDNRRLGKQRVECLQILKALNDPTYGWQNHPAVKMWRGWECTLMEYSVAVCREWTERGFKDTCLEKLHEVHYHKVPVAKHIVTVLQNGYDEYYTPWLNNPAFHASHRSNLLRKDPQHYGQFGWTEPNDLPYVWPVG